MNTEQILAEIREHPSYLMLRRALFAPTAIRRCFGWV